MTLKISTDNIPDAGFILEEELGVTEADLNTEGVTFIQPVRIKAEVLKNRKEITVKAHVESSAKMRCSRCLEWCETKIEKNIIKNYEASQRKTIDLWQELREDLILDYPMKPLCCEDCRGLCRVCGKKLNANLCDHQTEK